MAVQSFFDPLNQHMSTSERENGSFSLWRRRMQKKIRFPWIKNNDKENTKIKKIDLVVFLQSLFQVLVNKEKTVFCTGQEQRRLNVTLRSLQCNADLDINMALLSDQRFNSLFPWPHYLLKTIYHQLLRYLPHYKMLGQISKKQFAYTDEMLSSVNPETGIPVSLLC